MPGLSICPSTAARTASHNTEQLFRNSPDDVESRSTVFREGSVVKSPLNLTGAPAYYVAGGKEWTVACSTEAGTIRSSSIFSATLAMRSPSPERISHAVLADVSASTIEWRLCAKRDDLTNARSPPATCRVTRSRWLRNSRHPPSIAPTSSCSSLASRDPKKNTVGYLLRHPPTIISVASSASTR